MASLHTAALGMLACMLMSPEAHADKFRTLYAFAGGTDGKLPHSVIEDAAGNVYGTTAFGGDAAWQWIGKAISMA